MLHLYYVEDSISESVDLGALTLHTQHHSCSLGRSLLTNHTIYVVDAAGCTALQKPSQFAGTSEP